MRHLRYYCALGVLIIGLQAVAPGAENTPAAGGTDNAQTTPAGRPAGHKHSAQSGEGQNGQPESNLDYLWRKSDEAFHAGDYERAVGLHKAIEALDPTDVESYSVASWLLWSMGKGDEALQLIERGIKANPNNWDMWDEAGQQYELQKKAPEAENAYVQAVKLIPKEEDSQMLRRRLAHAAERHGDWQIALDTWRGLVQDFPAEPVNKNNLARVEKQMLQATNKS
ncbi:MAG: tetratricopeptide repeat protein [Abitibacteriaceae bacterium]|nr:tetratricopeptide repeat protein [Abditibacteriaceae bacterium]MBV9863864.1 tetratricopeptide repeat protein [Abditibacteriaceae bacterium]